MSTRKAEKAEYYNANRERFAARARARYKAKRDAILRRQRDYYDANRDAIRLRKKTGASLLETRRWLELSA